MPLQMPFFHDQPDHTYTVTLDEVQYEVRLVYRDRVSSGSWYLDLSTAEGVSLLRGRRVSPDFTPGLGLIPGGPAGLIVATGSDPYPRDEVALLYFTAAELAAGTLGEA